MGFFSWKTSDTNRSISNCFSSRGTFPVYLLCPDGTVIEEIDYEGYGVFDGQDIYVLLAKWNIPEQCKDENENWLPDDDIRSYGMEIAFSEDNKTLTYPIKFVEDPEGLSYDEVEPSINCEYQGYFYPEDEEDDDEEFCLGW